MVYSGHRLIQQQQVRLIHDCHGKKHSLQLSSREVAHLLVDELLSLKYLECLPYLCLYLFALWQKNRIIVLIACYEVIHADRCIFLDIDRLRHIADFKLSHMSVLSILELNRTGVRYLAEYRLYECRFSGTVLAYYDIEGATVYVHIYILKHCLLSKAHSKVIYFYAMKATWLYYFPHIFSNFI